MKYISKLLLVSVLICALLSLAAFALEETQSIVYTDVPADAPYAASVYKLSQYGVLNGYEDGSFRPEGEVTRAEMAKMVGLTFGITDYVGAAGFSDVKAEDWFYPYVLAAQKADIVNGYGDGTYAPMNNITRQEVCAIVYRLAKPYDLPTTRTITDEIGSWAVDYVYGIVNNYLMPLEENNTFRATVPIKRYELADLLAKFTIEPVKPLTAEIRFFNKGEQYGATDVVVIGDTAVPPEIKPVPDNGYAFMGWKVKGNDDSQIVDVASVIVEGNVDYESVFAKLYTVTFYNGDEVHETQQIPSGKYASKPNINPKFGDMKFSGWYLTNESIAENETAVNFNKYPITKDTSFYARYTEPDTSDPGTGGGPTEPVNPNSEEMMEKLDRGYRQLVAIPMTNDKHIYIRSIIVDCVDSLIKDANEGNFIDKNYVSTYYDKQVDEIEYLVLDSNYLTPREASELSNLITNGVEKDVREFMKEYFNLEV